MGLLRLKGAEAVSDADPALHALLRLKKRFVGGPCGAVVDMEREKARRDFDLVGEEIKLLRADLEKVRTERDQALWESSSLRANLEKVRTERDTRRWERESTPDFWEKDK